jgi:ribokinase
MSAPIAVVGSLNADFVINVSRFPLPGETLTGEQFRVFPGGKGANQAFAAARLGGSVRMIGQVGNDSQARWLKQNLASAGVDVSQVRHDQNVSSGIATITIDAQGQNQIIIVPGANGTFSPGQLELSRQAIASSGLVLLQLEVPLDTVQAAARWARESGAVVILDPAPALAVPDSLLACADYVTPNETELAILTGRPPATLERKHAASWASGLLKRGARKVIVKMGGHGALLVSDGEELFWPAFPVKAVDTTAAGDAFNAAFAWALSEGRPEFDAGRFASAAAACSVTHPGAQPSMPARAEVEHMLNHTTTELVSND